MGSPDTPERVCDALARLDAGQGYASTARATGLSVYRLHQLARRQWGPTYPQRLTAAQARYRDQHRRQRIRELATKHPDASLAYLANRANARGAITTSDVASVLGPEETRRRLALSRGGVPSWTREQCIAALREAYRRVHPDAPEAVLELSDYQQLAARDPALPHPKTVRQRLGGTWRRALMSADLPAGNEPPASWGVRWRDEDVTVALARFVADTRLCAGDPLPSMRQYIAWASRTADVPSAGVVVLRYGSWAAAKAAVARLIPGAPAPSPTVERETT